MLFNEGSSFGLGGRGMTVAAVMSSTADSSFPILFVGGPILTNRLSFCPSVLALGGGFFPSNLPAPPPPPFLARTETVLTLYYLKPFYFLTASKQKCFHEKRALPLCLNLLRGITLLLLRLKKTRDEFEPACLLLPPINFAGFLAAAPGSSEDNADLGKQPLFSAAYLLRWQGSRNHNWWNIIKTNPQNRFMISFNAGSFSFKSLISLSLHWIEWRIKIYLFPILRFTFHDPV